MARYRAAAAMGVLSMNILSVESLITGIRSLLEQYRVKYWTEYFKQIEKEFERARLLKSDWRRHELLEGLQELYGGMGSFNDYVITRFHGDAVPSADEVAVNKELNYLRHQLALAIREELQEAD